MTKYELVIRIDEKELGRWPRGSIAECIKAANSAIITKIMQDLELDDFEAITMVILKNK